MSDISDQSRITNWRSPDDIASDNFAEHLRSCVLQMSRSPRTRLYERWSSAEQAAGFCRIALDSAIRVAIAVEAEDPEPILDELKRLASMSRQAHVALDQLARWLAPLQQSHADLVLPLATSKALQGADRSQLNKAALALWSSRDTLQKLAATSTDRVRLLRKKRQHQGDPSFRAFAAVVGESWIFLFGKAPPLTRSGGPFHRFLASALYDAGGRVVDRSGHPVPLDDWEGGVLWIGVKAARAALPKARVDRALADYRLSDWRALASEFPMVTNP